VKYAIYLPNFGPYGDARVLAGLAQDAEQSGWDGFFVWDHIAGYKLPIADVWVALTAAALSTTCIRIGTTVTPLPRRRPWKIARETVSLDHLSGGRLTLGVGIGLGQDEWDNLGEEVDNAKRGAMLDEALDVLAGLWSGETFSYEGKHYHVKDACFLPVPVQQPRIPIWVGGFWPNKAPFRRAAKWDGAFPLFLEARGEEQELAQLKAAASYLAAQRDSAEPLDIICMGVSPGNQLDQAAEMAGKRADLGATWWLELIAPFRFDQGVEGEWPVDALRERILQGPPRP
jgi:alkanesulfonate monooxygenase SsuD/methylene tetrahydromethanopterin reductase-like flavin-dependent oxidoreductase (luciferase family)